MLFAAQQKLINHGNTTIKQFLFTKTKYHFWIVYLVKIFCLWPNACRCITALMRNIVFRSKHAAVW